MSFESQSPLKWTNLTTLRDVQVILLSSIIFFTIETLHLAVLRSVLTVPVN